MKGFLRRLSPTRKKDAPQTQPSVVESAVLGQRPEVEDAAFLGNEPNAEFVEVVVTTRPGPGPPTVSNDQPYVAWTMRQEAPRGPDQLDIFTGHPWYWAWNKPIWALGASLKTLWNPIQEASYTLRVPPLLSDAGGPLLKELLKAVDPSSLQEGGTEHPEVRKFLAAARGEIERLLAAPARNREVKEKVWALFCAAKRFALPFSFQNTFSVELERKIFHLCYQFRHPSLLTFDGLSELLSESFKHGGQQLSTRVGHSSLHQLFSPRGCELLHQEAINMAAFRLGSLDAHGVYIDAFDDFKKALNGVVAAYLTPRARAAHPLVQELTVASAYFIHYDKVDNHHEQHMDVSDLTFNTCISNHMCRGGELVLHHPEDKQGLFKPVSGSASGVFLYFPAIDVDQCNSYAAVPLIPSQTVKPGFLVLKSGDIVVTERSGPAFPLLHGYTVEEPNMSGLFDPSTLSVVTDDLTRPEWANIHNPWGPVSLAHSLGQTIVHGGRVLHSASPVLAGSRTQFIFWLNATMEFSFFFDLGRDLVHSILLFLRPKDVASLVQASKRCNELVKQSAFFLQYCERHFPGIQEALAHPQARGLFGAPMAQLMAQIAHQKHMNFAQMAIYIQQQKKRARLRPVNSFQIPPGSYERQMRMPMPTPDFALSRMPAPALFPPPPNPYIPLSRMPAPTGPPPPPLYGGGQPHPSLYSRMPAPQRMPYNFHEQPPRRMPAPSRMRPAMPEPCIMVEAEEDDVALRCMIQ